MFGFKFWTRNSTLPKINVSHTRTIVTKDYIYSEAVGKIMMT
jgi:hypothetical protein